MNTLLNFNNDTVLGNNSFLSCNNKFLNLGIPM